MKYTLILLIMTFTVLLATAQTDKEKIELGVKKYEEGEYINAYKLIFPLSRSKYMNADAKNCMGEFYRGGVKPKDYSLYLDYNYEIAMKWYKKAADDGNTAAMISLGSMYNSMESNGDNEKKKHQKESLSWYQKAITKGDPEAQSLMGDFYAAGAVVPQDYAESVRLHRLSADQNSSMGILSLAGDYKDGVGMQKDVKEAAKLYFSLIKRKGQKSHYPKGRSIYLLNNLIKTSWPTKFLSELEEITLAVETCIAGSLFNEGFTLLSRNSQSRYMTDTAFNWLGYLYDQGNGTAINYEAALKCFKKSAEMGNPTAQYNVGNYLAGNKVYAKDEVAAFTWYLKSANQGFVSAQTIVGEYYLYGTGVKKNEIEGIQWLRKAADKGNFFAQYDLGIAYKDGLGVQKDHDQSQRWLGYSAAQGYALADEIYEVSIAKRKEAAAQAAYVPHVYNNNSTEQKRAENTICSCCNGSGQKTVYSSQVYVEVDKYGNRSAPSNYTSARCTCCGGAGSYIRHY